MARAKHIKKRTKGMYFDVPNDRPSEVVRQRSLRKGTFSQARISALVLALVIALGIGGTLAYVIYTANQTPNRATAGEVGLYIVENGTKNTSGSATISAGDTTKQVQVLSEEATNRVDEVVRVTFVPQVEQKDSSGNVLGQQLLDEEWSAPSQTGDASNRFYIKTDLLTLYLADDWQDNYIYKDGAFIYNKVLEPGQTTPTLLQGVVWADSSKDSADYGTVKVNVVADAIQASPAEALSAWGVQVDASKNVTLSGASS